ncbi:hypothetical protein BN1012_Phect244 [Candidatus Phaeomarinobacter ectocarpi]|uniref:Cysteine-rich CPCC domain-containing protein n=1 Tax=Candidatus Phaeomarinibacter ectocarpi TaxID=1458461 RepID=X5M670_9HYPH|nr:CPCC family cysteine-rich protein [Candidatus Phaeomarinobacter ectocarpi]CDO58458.1 hypothetical protein BN1012_Phect244 [Candidatus Phaeomarinobacter ectocarpi]
MFPCVCCGYLVNDEPPGSHNICPICGWEDDISQLRFPELAGGANKLSLLDAQSQMDGLDVSNKARALDVRREVGWRLIDLELDDIERPVSGNDYGVSYPEGERSLYYWADEYWRRTRN